MKPKCFSIGICMLIGLSTLYSALADAVLRGSLSTNPDDDVTYHLVESIPEGTDIPHNMTTFEAWHELISQSHDTVDLAGFYMTLTGGSYEHQGYLGEYLYQDIQMAAKRGVRVRVVLTEPSSQFPQSDAIKLAQAGYCELRFINFTKIFGDGVLHTKMMIADNSSMYVGSANLDWRALSQIKEMGFYARNAGQLAWQTSQIFEIYWAIAQNSEIPNPWPASLHNAFNASHPVPVSLNGSSQTSSAFLAIAPPAFAPSGWASDLDTIVHHMLQASVVNFEMMDFFPEVLYVSKPYYWDVIDHAIRASVYNNQTRFRILIGHWSYSIQQQESYLQSLAVLPNVEVRYYTVPQIPNPVPYTRVAHAKWMVTDKALYVGTSNWLGDYFINTAGVSISLNDTNAVQLGQSIFERDWNSKYSQPMPMPSL